MYCIPKAPLENWMDRVQVSIDNVKKERQILQDQLTKDLRLEKIECIRFALLDKVYRGMNEEMLTIERSLLERTIIKLEKHKILRRGESSTAAASSSSCSSSDSPVAGCELLPIHHQWFYRRFQRKVTKLKGRIWQNISEYVNERRGTEKCKLFFVKSALNRISLHYQEFLFGFEQADKSLRGIKNLLNRVKELSTDLDLFKKGAEETSYEKVYPINRCLGSLIKIQNKTEQLLQLKREYVLLETELKSQRSAYNVCKLGDDEALEHLLNVVNVDVNTICKMEELNYLNNLYTEIEMQIIYPKKNGYRMLHIAAYANHLSLVHILLQAGANPGIKDEYGFLPIFSAAARKDSDPKDQATTDRRSANIIQLLHQAGSPINPPGGRCLFIEKGFFGNVKLLPKPEGITPLHVAVHSYKPKTVKKLLELGANINSQTSKYHFKETALMIAIQRHNHKIVPLLLQYPEINLRLESNDRFGIKKTAFHYAIESGITKTIDTLLNHPSMPSSIYFSDNNFFYSLLNYAKKFALSEQQSRAEIIYTIRMYEIKAQREKLRQRFHVEKNEQKAGIYAQICKNNPTLNPSAQAVLLEKEFRKLDLGYNQKLEEFSNKELYALRRELISEYPGNKIFSHPNKNIFSNLGHPETTSESISSVFHDPLAFASSQASSSSAAYSTDLQISPEVINPNKPNLELPQELLLKIFTNLNYNSLCEVSLVNKEFYQIANDYNTHKDKKAFLEHFAFGNEKWKKYFGSGVVEGENPQDEYCSLPNNIIEILKGPCPIQKNKRLMDTHTLVRIPKTLNGQLTLKSFRELTKKHFDNPNTSFNQISNQTSYDLGDVSIDKSYWVLITNEILPKTNTVDQLNKKQLVTTLSEETGIQYRIPNILEAAVCFMARNAVLANCIRSKTTRFSYPKVNALSLCQSNPNDELPSAIVWMKFTPNRFKDIRTLGVNKTQDWFKDGSGLRVIDHEYSSSLTSNTGITPLYQL